MKNQQKGSIVLWVIIILLVVIIVIGAIYTYELQASQQKLSTISNSNQSSQTPAAAKPNVLKSSATIYSNPVVSQSSFPVITGTAVNESSVVVDVETLPYATGDVAQILYKEKVPVTKGKWSFTLSPSNAVKGGSQGLSPGSYNIVVSQEDGLPLTNGLIDIAQ